MSVQLLIVLLYVALIVGIGVYTQKMTKSSAAFTGAGMGVLMIVAASCGEWLGGTSTTGVSEYGYTSGLSGSWYTIANGIGVLFLAIFFAKLFRSIGSITVPGIIERYLGVQARSVASVLLIIVMITVGASQVIAAGTLGVTLLHLPFVTSVIVLGIAFIVYTWAGGMKAVGYTNVVHLIVMYGSVLLGLYYAVKGVPGGMATFHAQLPPKYFSFFGIGTSKVWGWIVASVLGACTAQAGLQPVLAAKDVNTARTASFLTALIVAPFGIITALLGMAAKISFPNLPNAKLALPTLMMQMPPLVGGIVLAGIFAAILSTVSPIILAAGTMAAKDLYQRVWRPDASDQQVLLIGRIATAAAGLICIILAIIFYTGSTILDMVYFAYTLRGSIFVVLLLGIYWRRTSSKGAIWGMVATAAVGLFWVVYHSVTGHFPIHPEFNETFASVVAALVFTVLFSLVLRQNTTPGTQIQYHKD